MAKEPRHKKMYANSPVLATDEDGKKYIKKGPTAAEKEASQVNAGTDGVPQHDGAIKELMDRHARERLELHQKHETDYLSMGQKTMQTAASAMEGGKAPSGDTGADKIKKIENNKGE